jgi:hypothetical protein
MSRSLEKHTRNIYCTKNPFQYKILKTVTGHIHIHTGLTFYHREVIDVNENCDDLVQQCQIKFGNDYQYIQSGLSYSGEWDSVKANGQICQYYTASNHYDDD